MLKAFGQDFHRDGRSAIIPAQKATRPMRRSCRQGGHCRCRLSDNPGEPVLRALLIGVIPPDLLPHAPVYLIAAWLWHAKRLPPSAASFNAR
jgi:hypothetical protein